MLRRGLLSESFRQIMQWRCAMVTIVSRTLSVHKEHEVLLKLEAAGLTDALAQKLVESRGNDLAAKVVRLIANNGFESSTSQKRARELMGSNFFGAEEVIAHFGVNPTKAQFATLAEVPYTEEVLAQCKDSHLLVAVFPLSILVVREKAPRNPKTFYAYDNAWYNTQKFAKIQGEVGWHLVRKTSVVNSTNKTWDEQQALLTANEETPTAQIMIYAIVGHFLATGVRLFSNVYVRTSDTSDGHHVYVGGFDAGGLSVDYRWDGTRFGSVGVASAWKSACR